MPEDFSLIRFNVINFFAVVINARPFQATPTLLYKLVVSIVQSIKETNENEHRLKKLKEDLQYIYNYTDKTILNNLSIVELVTYKNLDSSLNREIDINGAGFTMAQLYEHLDGVTLKLTKMVIEIAKEYSIDIPFNAIGNSGLQKVI